MRRERVDSAIPSDLHEHRQHQRAPPRTFLEEPAQLDAQFLRHQSLVASFLHARSLDAFGDHASGVREERFRVGLVDDEAAGDDLRIADKAPAGRVLIDGTRTGEVGDEVLRDRRHLAGDGVIVAVVAINRQTGMLVGEPELVARGFVVGEGEADSLFADAAGVIAACIHASGVEERGDQGLMTEKLRVELRRFFKKRSGRRPLVLPILMEI